MLPVAFLLGCAGSDTSGGMSNGQAAATASWSIDSTPLLEIGGNSTQPGHDLYRVVGAIVREDGSVAVASSGSFDVRIFSRTGELQARAGQRGEGPGDFSPFMSGLARCGGDSLAVMQPGRITVLAPGGELSRVIAPPPYEGGPPPEPVSAGPDSCEESVWRLRRAMPLDTSGYVEQAYSLIRRDAYTHAVVTQFAGTVRYRTEVNGQPAMIFIPWHPEPAYTAHNGSVFWTSGADDIITYWRAAGDSVSLKWSARREAISDAERELYTAARSERIAEEPNYARSLLPWEQLPHKPTEHPTVAQMFVDGDHHVWLRPFPARSNGIGDRLDDDAGAFEVWSILSIRDGAQAQITLPVALSLTDIGEQHIAGVWTDDEGLESVRVYRLNRR